MTVSPPFLATSLGPSSSFISDLSLSLEYPRFAPADAKNELSISLDEKQLDFSASCQMTEVNSYTCQFCFVHEQLMSVLCATRSLPVLWRTSKSFVFLDLSTPSGMKKPQYPCRSVGVILTQCYRTLTSSRLKAIPHPSCNFAFNVSLEIDAGGLSLESSSFSSSISIESLVRITGHEGPTFLSSVSSSYDVDFQLDADVEIPSTSSSLSSLPSTSHISQIETFHSTSPQDANTSASSQGPPPTTKKPLTLTSISLALLLLYILFLAFLFKTTARVLDFSIPTLLTSFMDKVWCTIFPPTQPRIPEQNGNDNALNAEAMDNESLELPIARKRSRIT